MSMVQGVIAFILLLVVNSAAKGEEYRNVEVKKLITSTTSSNGDPLLYLQTAQPEVTALIVTIPPGGSTGWHKHPVPVYAYVMEGVLNVELKSGLIFLIRGESVYAAYTTGFFA